MMNWAEKEIEIACKKEAPDLQDGEWDYGCACYKSALKAYKALCEDRHSGASIMITKNILDRLILFKPLTPIEDVPEVWNHVHTTEDGTKEFQCTRMSSLFKDVDVNGNVKFNDTDRFLSININDNKDRFYSGLVNRTLNDMFPITLPYYPSSTSYHVYVEEFLVDKSNGDFDTVGIFYMISPEGEKIPVNRFFTAEVESWIEITEAEYIDLKSKKIS